MKRYVIWLDEDGDSHVAEWDNYEGDKDWVTLVVGLEPGTGRPIFFTDYDCTEELGLNA